MKKEKLDKINNKILNEHNDKEIVLGDGSVDSKVILIGEAPGANEVKQRKPFVGQAGKYLEEFLNTLELDRKDLYITNTVKFRPTRRSSKTGKEINRAPNKKEIEQFKEYLFSEIEVIAPKVIVTLGNVPLKAVTNDKDIKIGDLHGQLIQCNIHNRQYSIFPLYHPAAVIYNKKLPETYYKDLYNLKNVLKTFRE